MVNGFPVWRRFFADTSGFLFFVSQPWLLGI
jgi:hypothetical protein